MPFSDLIAALARPADCAYRSAAAAAFMTDPGLIPYETKRALALFYGKYWDR